MERIFIVLYTQSNYIWDNDSDLASNVKNVSQQRVEQNETVYFPSFGKFTNSTTSKQQF